MSLRCRYELEKQLMEGQVSVAELPKIWNERMTSYLGCTPKDDAQGVLQAGIPTPCSSCNRNVITGGRCSGLHMLQCMPSQLGMTSASLSRESLSRS